MAQGNAEEYETKQKTCTAKGTGWVFSKGLKPQISKPDDTTANGYTEGDLEHL